MSSATTTFARLRSGDWGARCIGYVPAVGDTIHITRRNGDVSRATVAVIVWQGQTDDGEPSALVTLDEPTPARPAPARRRSASQGRASRSTPAPAPQATPQAPASAPVAPAQVQATPETVAVVQAAVAFIESQDDGTSLAAYGRLRLAVLAWQAEVARAFAPPALEPDAVLDTAGRVLDTPLPPPPPVPVAFDDAADFEF